MTPGGLPDLPPRSSTPTRSSSAAPRLPETRRAARTATPERFLFQEAPVDDLDIEAGEFLVGFHFSEERDAWSIKDVFLFNSPDDAETMSAIAQQIKTTHADGSKYADHLNAYVGLSDFEERIFEVPPVLTDAEQGFLASFTFLRDEDGWTVGGTYLFNVLDRENALEVIAREIGNIDWSSSQPLD